MPIPTPVVVLRSWMQSVNNAQLERLCGLYDPTAVLIPTFSNRLLDTPVKIAEYFAKLASRDDLSVALHDKTLHVQSIQDELYTLSGIYCWRFSVEEEMLSFEARFSYLVDLTRESPILQHHSSQIPRML